MVTAMTTPFNNPGGPTSSHSRPCAWVPLLCTPSTALLSAIDQLTTTLTTTATTPPGPPHDASIATAGTSTRTHAVVRNAYAARASVCVHALDAMRRLSMRPPFSLNIEAIPIHLNTTTTTTTSTTSAEQDAVVQLPWQCRLLPPDVRRVMVDMAATHARITDATLVSGRVAIVVGTPCPKWHVDRVDLRSICTMYGPGTVLRRDHRMRYEALPKDVIAARAGDVVFLRGAGSDGSELERSVVHRSPALTDGVEQGGDKQNEWMGEDQQQGKLVRLIVQIDSWDSSTVRQVKSQRTAA